jgi:hypothetical protein
MTQMRTALFLPHRLAMSIAARAVHAAEIARRRASGKDAALCHPRRPPRDSAP